MYNKIINSHIKIILLRSNPFEMYWPSLICFSLYLFIGNGLVFAQQNIDSNQTTSLHSEEFKELWPELEKKSPAEIFEKANQDFMNKQYDEAIKTYKFLNSFYPFSEYSEKAALGMINAYYEDNKMDDVIHKVNQFIQWYPTSSYLEAVYQKRATAYFDDINFIVHFFNKLFDNIISISQRIDTQKLDQSARYMRDYLQRFPNGIYKTEVQEKLEDLNRLVLNRKSEEAEFYFTARNYMAAYNRIITLFNNYPRFQMEELIGKEKVCKLDHIYSISKKKLWD